MKRSDADKKAQAERMMEPMSPGGPDYPYGVRLRLEAPELKKLGIDRMPVQGDKYRVGGEFHVTGTAQEDTDQNSDRRVEGVMHSLGFEPMDGNSTIAPEKSIREELEDARHQARGTTAPTGRIGARINGGNNGNGR